MSSQSEERYARLTGSGEPEVPGGGIPLPGAFHDVLYYLLNNNRVALEEILVKVVRNAVGELHENRVLHVWGSWENLTGDLLDQLWERGFVTCRGTVWTLDPGFRAGRVKIMYFNGGKRELRITVRSKEEHETRELLARARSRAQDYRLQLEAWGLYDGKIGATFERHLDSLHWEGERDEAMEEVLEEAQEAGEARPYGSVAAYVRRYLKEQYPEWVSGSDIAKAFNAAHPDARPIPGHQPFDRLMVMVRGGKAERKVDEVHKYKGRPKVMFRWKPVE